MKEAKAIAMIIEKLKALKKAKEEYQSDVATEIMEEVLLDLVDVEDCIAGHSRPEDGLGGNFFPPTGAFTQNLMRDVQYTIKSPKPEDTNTLIQHLKKIQRRLENKPQQEHRDFLLEVAEKVGTWVSNEVVMKRFRKQAKAFYDEVVKYEGKEQTPDPVGRLVLPYATVSDAHIGLLSEDDYLKHISIPYNKEKSLPADYVLLTIIHDKRLKNPRTPPISDGIWSKDEEWVELKWQKIKNGYACGSEDIQTHIKLALKRIEKDLPIKPAVTEQKTTLSRGQRLGIWMKRVPRWIYVLVIFLAALLTCIYLLSWLWITFWKK